MIPYAPQSQPVLPEPLARCLNDSGLAAWYTAYNGEQESVCFVTQKFADWFNLSPVDIVARASYSSINGTDAPNEKFKADDRSAITEGFVLLREGSPPLTVIKVHYKGGILGLATNASDSTSPTIENLELQLLNALKSLKSIGMLDQRLACLLPDS